MPSVAVRVGAQIDRTARVAQIEATFDLPPAKYAEHVRQHELPIEQRDWRIGMIVGPSGSGKSRLLDTMYPDRSSPAWSQRALVDDFPKGPISDVTAALTAVGLSSPPAWVRAHSTLSNGEQFRADLAWRLLSDADPIVVDEFTSVVDRTVAHVASAAVAKHLRKSGTSKRLVVAACHYDVIDWLQPDWLYDTGTLTFEWRSLQRRPPIDVDISRSTDRTIWTAFAPHHYLTAELARGCKLFVATIAGRPAAMTSCLHMPHPTATGIWREHRTVVLPDYQGIGIGNAVVETVASVFVAAGLRWRATGSHPGIVQHRARSALWDMDRKPGFVARGQGIMGGDSWRGSTNRRTASFEYVGPAADRADVELLIPETLSGRTKVRPSTRRRR